MAIKDDVGIYPYSSVVRYDGTGVTQYTYKQVYSFIQSTFDEPAYHGYKNPMRYNTPTSYTWINGWMQDNGDGSEFFKYVYGGACDTSGLTNDVLVIDLDATTDFVLTDKDLDVTETTTIGPLLAYKNDYPVANDARIWVRDTNSHGTVDDGDSVTMVPAGGTGLGTADGASYTGDEIYGNAYNDAALAQFPSDVEPQIYVIQEDPDGNLVRVDEWSNTTNFDRGAFDIVIPVKIGGVLINSGLIDVFARQGGDLYAQALNVDLSGSTRTPVALKTRADEDNIKLTETNYIDWYMFFDNQTNAIAVDDVVQNVATGGATPPDWSAEVAYVDDWGTEGCLGLRSLSGTPTDGDSIFVGATDCADVNGTVGDQYLTYDTETTAPVVGDLGDPVEGSISGAHGVLRAYQSDTGSGKLILQVYHDHGTLDSQDYTGSGRDVLYTEFVDNDVLSAPTSGSSLLNVTLDAAGSRAVSGFSDITIAHVNGSVTISSVSGTFQIGEVIESTNPTATYICLTAAASGDTTMFLGNVDSAAEPTATSVFTGAVSNATANCDSTMTDDNTANYEHAQQSTGDTYNVVIEGGSIYNTGRSTHHIYAYNQLRCGDGAAAGSGYTATDPRSDFYTSNGTAITEVEGQRYTTAVATHTLEDVAPFGTLSGNTYTTAQGVWIQGMSTDDANNIRTTSHEGDINEPFPSTSWTVSNTRVDDVITIAPRDAADASLPDKDQYTGHATNNTQGGSTFDQIATGGGFPVDTATSGAFTVVATDENEEHRYRYASWNNTGGSGDDGQLVLEASDTGTAEAGSTDYVLQDTGVFVNAARGDIIRRTNGSGGWTYIESVDSANQVTTGKLSAGSGWSSGDTFETNRLVQAYDDSDTFWINYMDLIEDTGTDGAPGTAEVTLTYDSSGGDKDVLITVTNVYNASYKIRRFTAVGEVKQEAQSVTINRDTDTQHT